MKTTQQQPDTLEAFDRLDGYGGYMPSLIKLPEDDAGEPVTDERVMKQITDWPDNDDPIDRRCAILVDRIPGLTHDSAFLVHTVNGALEATQIAGPVNEATIGETLLRHHILNEVPPKPRGPIGLSSARLLVKYAATNDNAPQQSSPKPISATPFELRDPASMPLRDWLYGGHFIRRYTTASVGPGGGGKTAHSVTEGLAMVTGRPLLDPQGGLTKPLRVWWINAEDPQDEIDRRFHAAAKHFNVTTDQIGDRLFTDSGRDMDVVIAQQEGRDLKIVEPFVNGMVAEIKRRQIDVVIIDPFVSTHQAQENDNGAMQRVTAAWVRVADEANCGVELVHHVTKNQGEVTADSARGGGAFKDKVRSMRVFNAMTLAEAQKAGVDNHRAYFRVDFGKVNMVASGRSQWRRFVSVPLGNGNGLVKTGDEIGVVEPWVWPTSDDMDKRSAEARAALVSEVPPDLLAGLKSRMGMLTYKFDPKGKPSAAGLIVELGIAGDIQTAKIMLDAWISIGEFKVIKHHCEVARKPRDFVNSVFAPT